MEGNWGFWETVTQPVHSVETVRVQAGCGFNYIEFVIVPFPGVLRNIMGWCELPAKLEHISDISSGNTPIRFASPQVHTRLFWR
jgi:hypothetical protein